MRKKLNLIIISAVAGLISYYSLRPVETVPGTGGATNFTILHFLAYFALGGAVLLHVHDNTKGHLIAAFSAFSFGLAMEVIQTQIPSRYFSYHDLAIKLQVLLL
ncbi:MAG: VanZ family protein [Candidatus Nanohaloarchaea archaeon]